MSSGTVATTKRQTIKDHLLGDAFKQRVAAALPTHMKPDRMLQAGLTALIKTPKLATCTPESFLNCMLQLSQIGLEPDGRHAHLIPYGDQCTLIVDFKGLVELALRSGTIRLIHADVIYEGDLFDYEIGEVKKHNKHWLRTDADKPANEGKIIGAYCRVVFTDGTEKAEVMSTAEIEKVRQSSRAGGSGPWKDWWSEMAKKTVFRRASKWLKLSAEVADAFDKDDEQFRPARPAMQLSSLNEWQPAAVIDAPAIETEQA